MSGHTYIHTYTHTYTYTRVKYIERPVFMLPILRYMEKKVNWRNVSKDNKYFVNLTEFILC